MKYRSWYIKKNKNKNSKKNEIKCLICRITEQRENIQL